LLLLPVAKLVAADLAELAVASRCYKAGQYAECVRLTGPSDPPTKQSETALLLNIRANMARGEYPLALDTLIRAIEIYPASIRLRWIGGDVLRFNNRTADAETLLAQIGTLLEGFRWRYNDPVNYIVLGRFELLLGADPGQVLKNRFGAAKQAAADNWRWKNMISRWRRSSFRQRSRLIRPIPTFTLESPKRSSQVMVNDRRLHCRQHYSGTPITSTAY
jgi:hypothetical protein